MEQVCVDFYQRKFLEIEVTEKNNFRLSKQILDAIKDLKHGYFMECDLDYPPRAYEKIRFFPFCGMKESIKLKCFSKYMMVTQSTK